ncbi:MAG: signal peptide peptidase SppA, partial [Magnetococcales bacterium]|nr:signal peptide peptidase SppA [Magnetococcales bacterium]
RVLERLLEAQLTEQRKARRGRSLFRLFLAAYLIAILASFLIDSTDSIEFDGLTHKKHAAVINLEGILLAGTQNDATEVVDALESAFSDRNSAAVILRINSPGGSAVQSGIIHDAIRRLRKSHPHIPVYAALEDLCASGGYYVASAAGSIYADKATLVGSIGVIMQSFGVPQLIEKWGIENRTLTAGEHKAFLDPFQTVRPEEKAHAQALLNTIHQQFIKSVKEGRGERLKVSDDQLFNGLIWTGEEALRLGLVDGLASAESLAREKAGGVPLVDFTKKKDWLSRMSRHFGETLFNMVVTQQKIPQLM